MFVPRPLEPVQINKMPIKLYSSVINSTMKPPGRAHAFQINKTAPAASGIDRQMTLDTPRAQLNLSAIVNSVFSDWHRHFQRNWSNFARLSILSFHNDTGMQVDDTTTPANLAIILPVQDKQVSDCRKKQIQSV